ALQLHRTPHMIDVRVRHNDLLEVELMSFQHLEHPVNFVTRVDDQCLPCALVSDDRTITSEHSDREDFVNHLRSSKLKASRGRLSIRSDDPSGVGLSRYRLGFSIRSLSWSSRLRRSSVLRCRFVSLHYRVAGPAAHHHGKRDVSDHEDHGRPRGRLRENVGRGPRPKSCLRTHSAKGRSDIGALSALEQYDNNNKRAN